MWEYLSEAGMVGDNRDVRPPNSDEEWSGGVMGVRCGGGGGYGANDPVARVTLILDGVFFIDGEFAGPNREKLYEQTVEQAEAYALLGGIALECHARGLAAERILTEIEEITGHAPAHADLPPNMRNPNAGPQEFRHWALQRLATSFSMQRKFPHISNEQIVNTIIGWATASVPQFRQL